MKIKRFVGKNMQETIAQVKKELGRDAIILNTRNIREGGFLGFFRRSRVEVIAAVKNGDERESFKGLLSQRSRSYSRLQEEGRREKGSPGSSLSGSGYQRPKRVPGVSRRDERVPAGDKAVERRIAESNMAERIPAEGNPGRTNSSIEEEIRLLRKVMENSLIQDGSRLLPDLLKQELDGLAAKDVSAAITTRLATKMLEEDNLDWTDKTEVKKRLRNHLMGFLPEAHPLEVQPGENKVVALVGPTGVGKTTTLAKLAAGFTFENKLEVGLITIDTYRIAAVEQLRTYADIMDLPLSVVFTPDEFEEALKDFQNKDLILIDTAGRSPKNKMQMQELKNFLYRDEVDEIYLVLSLVTKGNDMLQAARSFAPLDIDKVILTKLDETNTIGSILDLLTEKKYRLSYVTTGQDVPEDIEIFYPEKIVNMLIAG